MLSKSEAQKRVSQMLKKIKSNGWQGKVWEVSNGWAYDLINPNMSMSISESYREDEEPTYWAYLGDEPYKVGGDCGFWYVERNGCLDINECVKLKLLDAKRFIDRVSKVYDNCLSCLNESNDIDNTNISSDRLDEVINDAVDGISHWGNIIDRRKLITRLRAGETFVIMDVESNDRWPINLGDINNGLTLLKEKYPERYSKIIEEISDIEDGDVLIQLSVFRDVVFG